MRGQPLTAENVRALLDYDPISGEFTIKRCSPENFLSNQTSAETKARKWNAREGQRIGLYVHPKQGYQHITILSRVYRTHRVAWLWMTGQWPDQIDHENGNRSDNRWSNLRNVSNAENGSNQKLPISNKTGVRGVHVHKASGKYYGQIKKDGVVYNLGYFLDIESAKTAVEAKRKDLSFHPNHGKEDRNGYQDV